MPKNFTGPNFLQKTEEDWPCNIAHDEEDANLEMREVYAHVGHIIPYVIDVTRFSSWNRLLRVSAWIVKACAKWKEYSKGSNKIIPNALTTEKM